MDSMVQCECRAPGEGLATLSALVGLLSGVNSPMLSKGGAVTEGLPTVAALVGLLSCVDLQMLSKG